MDVNNISELVYTLWCLNTFFIDSNVPLYVCVPTCICVHIERYFLAFVLIITMFESRREYIHDYRAYIIWCVHAPVLAHLKEPSNCCPHLKVCLVVTIQITVVAASPTHLFVLCLFSHSYKLCNHSFFLIYHSLSRSWLHYLPIFVMVHWYITNTIKPLTIHQLLANRARLQGWKISDITSDISSFPFIGSVWTNAAVLH